MGTHDLPDIKSELFTLADMYARSPQALGIHIRKITRAYVTTIKGNISSCKYFHSYEFGFVQYIPQPRMMKNFHVRKNPS